MPSKSKAQQRFMGMVHALKKGEMDPSDASPEVKKVAKSMKKKDAEDFASTKHKGKPNKVTQEWLKKTIRELIEQELNLEGTCGYGEDGELGDEPAGPHLLKIKKESFSELEAEKYDKKLKSAIKNIAKKDRKKGLMLMNFYKKHWIEFMIKSKQALGESILNEGEKEKIEQLLIKYGNTPEDAKQMVSKTYDYIKKAYRNANASKKAEIMSSLMKFETTESIVNLVEKCWKGYEKKGTKKMFGKTYPNCVKAENINPILHLDETTYKGFVKYMNDFYGPKGVYPDKKKRTLKMKDIGTAYSVLLKKKPDFEIGYDSTDREMLRDILIKMRKLDPDYSQKESVNEDVYIGYYKNKKVKVTAKSSKEAQKQIAKKLRVPKKDYDIASIQNLTKTKKNKHKFEAFDKMEMQKLQTAIKMFQNKIKKQGRITNARDEDHLKNLIKIYKQMGGKGIRESKTSDMMRAIRKGGTAGPWTIIVSKNNSIKRTTMVKNLKEIPAYMDDIKKKFPNHKIGIESKGGKIVYREAMDKRQGAETLKQLGGNRFIMMTGAKHFGVGPNGMSFKIGKNSKRVNHVTIDLDRGRDLYNMKFDWVTIKGIKNKKTLKGIYADQLQDMFTKYTGMYTSL